MLESFWPKPSHCSSVPRNIICYGQEEQSPACVTLAELVNPTSHHCAAPGSAWVPRAFSPGFSMHRAPLVASLPAVLMYPFRLRERETWMGSFFKAACSRVIFRNNKKKHNKEMPNKCLSNGLKWTLD